ncbi:MAG: GIY-YIG nuclease family protein [Parapedobacter sp.]|nr:MAG: GIY-YIG nuclease family protein [Parapedobacter sp.]
MFTVYVLHSEKYGKIYIGYTSNLQERLKSHNELGKKGWTVKFRPWTLVYSETYGSKAEAIHREKQLKSAKGRQFIRNLINGPEKK